MESTFETGDGRELTLRTDDGQRFQVFHGDSCVYRGSFQGSELRLEYAGLPLEPGMYEAFLLLLAEFNAPSGSEPTQSGDD